MTSSSAHTAPIHIFKAGRHTAMAGQALAFAAADLAAVASAYNPALHEAPLVVGHPSHDLPAYGWVQSLRYSDGSDGLDAGLWALPAQVNPAFADLVAAGAYKKISAAFYTPESPNNPSPGRYYLRHVGFLGAQAPAVKGLRSPAFADAEEGVLTLEFTDRDFQPPATKESTVTEEEAARLRADNEAQAARIAQLEADAQTQRRATVHAQHAAFADTLVAEGRLISAAKDVVVATLDHLAEQSAPVEFGEGDQKAPLLDSLKATLKASPVLVSFGESAARDRAATGADTGTADPADAAFADSAEPERLKQHQAIKAHMATHKVDYATAAAAVMK